MTPPNSLGIILAVFVISFVGLLIAKRCLKKMKPYKFKLIFRTPGLDNHVTVYGDSLDFTHEIGETEYEIKAERLYRLKPKIHTKIWYKFRGIKESFIIVYQHKKTDPVAPTTVKVSARILKEVSESRALDKAMRSEFAVPWDLKKILMVVGFLVIAVVVYVLMSGEIVI